MGMSQYKARREVISTGFVPRPHQVEILQSLKRFNVVVCHRRFGKTVAFVNLIIDKGLRLGKKNPQFAYMAPFYGQAKRVAWEYFKEYGLKIPGSTANEAELRIDIPRPGGADGSSEPDKIRMMLLGADNPGALRGLYLDGVVLDEYGEMTPDVFNQVIRPALSDRLGWAVFTGTPKGQNHFADILEHGRSDSTWYTSVFRAEDTGIIPKAELEAARALMSEEEFLQEFQCSFTSAMMGAYYKTQMELLEKKGQIGNVPHDPGSPVHTAWDLGINDANVVWFYQIVGREIHLIDLVAGSGEDLAFYAIKIKEKAQAGNWLLGRHKLPHDANARELQTGKTRVEALEKLLGRTIDVVARHGVEDGIHRARMVLPRCWFDRKNCEYGLKGLKNYQKKWDSVNKVFSSRPLHNWASNPADAFRYMAMGFDEMDDQRIDGTLRRNLPRRASSDYDPFSL